MYRGIGKQSIALLILLLVLSTILPAATAQVQIRKQAVYDDTIYNNEIIILPLKRTIFHRETLAGTDTEAFALSPLPSAGGNGFALAQTSSETAVATQTGFFDVNLPFLWLPEYPGQMIGDTTGWAANVQPIGFAGLQQNQMLVFPSMAEINRIEDEPGGNFSYAVDTKNMVPYLPGNVMLVKNVTNAQGENETVLERPQREYMTLIPQPGEVANRTILERMWRNVHINFQMDRAYVGATCFPDLVYPIRQIYTLMPFVPDETSISAALNMTQPGRHIRRIFWPVGN